MRKMFSLALFIPFLAIGQKLPSIEEKTRDTKKYEGYLSFYWDENNGKILLEINRLDTELLYVTSLPAGLGSNDIGLDRGLLGDQAVVKFVKTGGRSCSSNPIITIVQ